MRLFYILLAFLFFNSCSKQDYIWTSIGDSITWQNGKEYKDGSPALGYQDLLVSSQNKPVYIDNQGFSGLSLAGSGESVYSKLKNYNFKKSDLVTIFVGTNDFKLNKPIKSDDSLNSFKYCLISLITSIRNQNSHAKIFIFTPLQRDKDGFNIYCKNEAGLYLNDYRYEIINIGKQQKIEVIDLYINSGINSQNLKKFTSDGLHPNNEGYQLIATELLKSIHL